jgi:hypothetical protein
MFTVYLDDSGTSPSQKIAIATALVIPARQIVRLESEWAALKRKEGFSSFHASEFVARNPKSEFANWGCAKQERVFRRVREISKKYGTIAFSFAVNKEDYDQVVPSNWRIHFGKHHYTWAVRHLMKFLDQWHLTDTKVVPPPLQYVFDWMGNRKDERRQEVELVLEQAESVAVEHGLPGYYTNYNFLHRKEIAGLQCVDAMGWVCYQTALQNFRGVPLHSLAEAAFKEYEKRPRMLHAVTVTRVNLQKWIVMEMEHPKAIELFEKWDKKKSGH